jgi:CelD/BcsL family acetyltransferase involved in cellulose biosynthesis
MDLHNQRFAAISVVFATAARRRFHLLAAQRMVDAGIARIYRLVAEGRNAGLQYDFALGDRVFFYSSRILPSAGRSPGLVLLGSAISSAVDEGFREFDLLRGDDLYKLRSLPTPGGTYGCWCSGSRRRPPYAADRGPRGGRCGS